MYTPLHHLNAFFKSLCDVPISLQNPEQALTWNYVSIEEQVWKGIQITGVSNLACTLHSYECTCGQTHRSFFGRAIVRESAGRLVVVH